MSSQDPPFLIGGPGLEQVCVAHLDVSRTTQHAAQRALQPLSLPHLDCPLEASASEASLENWTEIVQILSKDQSKEGNLETICPIP